MTNVARVVRVCSRRQMLRGTGIGLSGILAGGALSACSTDTGDSDADVIVVGLIGERAREVGDFVGHVMQGEAAKKQALAIYKSITGEFPKGAWWETTVPVPPSLEVRSRIKASQIAFANRRQGGSPTGAQA